MTKRCCCGCFSITTGAQILAALEVINVLGGIFYVDDSLIDGKNIIRYSGLGFGGVITLIAAILVFVACSKKQPVLMLPMIILAAILLFFIAIVFGYCVYMLCDQQTITEHTKKFNATGDEKDIAGLSTEEIVLYRHIGVTIFIGILLASSIWYLSVFRNCYKHLKEERW